MKFPWTHGGLTIALVLAAPAHAANPVTLKGAAHGLFRVGAALDEAEILEQDHAAVAIVDREFNSISPENALKWDVVHPQASHYDFKLADKYVDFGHRHGMFVVGHTLMWHSQAPRWLFRAEGGKEVSREELLRRLQEHIRTVVGRYRGRIDAWDVVNEAIRDEDGQIRTEKPWYRILGEEGVFAAFAAAHEADPNAELYYNDYAVENPVKRAGILKLVQAIRARGLRIDGVGSQEHISLDWPKVSQIDDTLDFFGRAGFKVVVTEMDVTVLPRPDNYNGADVSVRRKSSAEWNPYPHGLPSTVQDALTRRYADIFAVFARHCGTLTRVTLWGVTDRQSWLNEWPIPGRTDYPLLFDRDARPKPAFAAVVAALSASASGTAR